MSAERYRVSTPPHMHETTHKPPVHVTYTRSGDGWDMNAVVEGEDASVPGFPMTALPDLGAPRACAWTVLRRNVAIRPVAEHVTGDDVHLPAHASGWMLRGGTTLRD